MKKLPNTVILSFDVDGQMVYDYLNRRDPDNPRPLIQQYRSDKDYFLEEGLIRAIAFLKSKRLDATFFTIGKNIIDFPDIHNKLKDFEIGNHTYSHPNFFSSKTFIEKKDQIKKGHAVIKDFYGITPNIFRAPDYHIDADMIKILKDLGYKGDSSIIKVLLPPSYFLNYIKQRAILKDQFEFPPTSFIIPFNGTSVIFYGLALSKTIFEYLLRLHKVIIIIFHDRDFINMKIERVGFWKREKALETTIKFIEYMNERCNIMSFRQFFDRSHSLY